MLEIFNDGFETIRVNFKRIFKELFGGGSADLVIEPVEEGQDPLDAGIEIVAEPPGKKLQKISLLSGGEKSLTALAFVFSIQRYMPAPFYAFDEVDASLDTMNVERIAQMVQNQAKDTQFIVVSHRKPMIESANRTIGVTQKEKGITRVTGIKLRDEV